MAEEAVRKKLLRVLTNVQETYSLQAFNPLKAGGVADFFTKVTSAVELAAAVKAALDNDLPYCIIGNAGAVLFSDSGFPGLVIHNRTEALAVSREKSQIVVDTGMSLARLAGVAAAQGLGGFTEFAKLGGTVGGAIYTNPRLGQHNFHSFVRFVTVINPPARLDKEATINRYRSQWLTLEGGEVNRLQKNKQERPLRDSSSVLLTALLQCTQLRQDEVQGRLAAALKDPAHQRPEGDVFGPVLAAPDDIPLRELAQGAQVHRLRVGTLYPDKKNPLYLRSKGVVRSDEIVEMVALMKQAIEGKYGVSLTSPMELVGVW